MSKANSHNRRTRWRTESTIGMIVLILLVTLYPFNFSSSNIYFVQQIIERFQYSSSNALDFYLNILLFLYLGFSLTGTLNASIQSKSKVCVIVLLFSVLLSAFIEVLQVLLPSRSSTLSDLVSNGLGGLLGSFSFFLWKLKLWRLKGSYQRFLLATRHRNHFLLSHLIANFIGYIIFICLLSIALQSPTNLKNRDSSFPLILGNERTGDRAWQGSISEVYVASRAITRQEIANIFAGHDPLPVLSSSALAAYSFDEKKRYQDQTYQSPDLVWQGASLTTQNSNGVFLTPNSWLVTAAPVATLTQALRNTSEFTLITTIATADLNQSGPARVISISGDPYQRNLTLGQEGSQLIIRLRTPLTAENGKCPELVFPGIFSDTYPHRLIITYNRSLLHVYVDNLQQLYSLEFAPEVTLFRYLISFVSPAMTLDSFTQITFKTLYYLILFSPLGVLQVLIIRTLKLRQLPDLYISLLLYSGVLLPSLVVEGILSNAMNRQMRIDNLLLSTGLMLGIVLLLLKMVAPSSLKHKQIG